MLLHELGRKQGKNGVIDLCRINFNSFDAEMSSKKLS